LQCLTHTVKYAAMESVLKNMAACKAAAVACSTGAKLSRSGSATQINSAKLSLAWLNTEQASSLLSRGRISRELTAHRTVSIALAIIKSDCSANSVSATSQRKQQVNRQDFLHRKLKRQI